MPAAAAMALQDAPSEQAALRSAAFASLGLTEQLLHALSELNLEEPTEVQVWPNASVLHDTQPDTSQASSRNAPLLAGLGSIMPYAQYCTGLSLRAGHRHVSVQDLMACGILLFC